jgi:hypothetical protein
MSILLYGLWFGLCVVAGLAVFNSKYSFQQKMLASFFVLFC